MPPMPLDTATPIRSGSASGCPASAQASRAATMASCSHRSSRRDWTRSSTVAGSTAAGAAMHTGRSAGQSSGSRRAPLRPASSASQVLPTSPPSGVVAPSPVTTTVVWSVPTVICSSGFRSAAMPAASGVPSGGYARALHEQHDVLDGLEVLQLVVGDLHAEPVLRGDRDLDHGQRVDVQIVNEALVGGHLVGRHSGDLVDDLAESSQNLLLGHGHVSVVSFSCRRHCAWFVPSAPGGRREPAKAP